MRYKKGYPFAALRLNERKQPTETIGIELNAAAKALYRLECKRCYGNLLDFDKLPERIRKHYTNSAFEVLAHAREERHASQ